MPFSLLKDHLNIRSSSEPLSARTPPRIELPHFISSVEDEDVPSHEAAAHRRHLIDRYALVVVPGERHPVQLANVGRGRGRHMVESRGSAAPETNELGEVGEEARRLAALYLPVLHRYTMEIYK